MALWGGGMLIAAARVESCILSSCSTSTFFEVSRLHLESGTFSLRARRRPVRHCATVCSTNTTIDVLDDTSVENKMDQYVHCVRACNRGRERRPEFLPFAVEGNIVGYIHPRFAEHLKEFSEVFSFKTERKPTSKELIPTVQIYEKLEAAQERTDAVENSLRVLRDKGLVPGWRNEHYPVVSRFDSPAFFSLERAVVPFFGTKAYGVHMNGYVTIDGAKRLWVAKRSKSKQTYPGFLDHLVAGGQPVGLSCQANLVKECEEEAGIPKALAQKAVPVGAVSYEDINGDQYKRDVLFCYDLELPSSFQPSNTDGEVECFSLDSIPKVIHNLRYYKPNCALVVIDFLFRHGYIRPEEKGYLQLLQSLKSGETSILKRS